MSRFANKFFLLFLFYFTGAAAHEQLLLVVADDMNTSTALLQRYAMHAGQWARIGTAFPVNLGRNGLGWGIGMTALPRDPGDPVKQEGDGRAPAGIFALGPVFGYGSGVHTAMPYLRATDDLICIDDSRSPAYNRVVRITPKLRFGSFEWMHRDDDLYALGIVVQHNTASVPGMGSCIFMHFERAPGAGTAGCTSMARSALQSVVRWLDPDKAPLLVQVPRKSLPDVARRFKGIPE